jgi:hypothetical protein
MPMAATSMMKRRVCSRPACAGLRAKRPRYPDGRRAGLGQRAGSRRIGRGQKRPAGKGHGERVVMDLRRELCRSDAELGREIGGGGAAQAITTARKALVVLMLVMRQCLSGVMRVIFRAGLGVSGTQVKRSMGVAARKRERQQHDQAAQEEGSLHCNEHVTPRGGKGSTIPA